jgi:hypothetical protein
MRLRTMPVPFEKCTGQRIGLALRTLRNISLVDVLLRKRQSKHKLDERGILLITNAERPRQLG